MGQKILILGGTRDAMQLAETLVAQGHDVTTSLAGRTHNPAPLVGKVRIGGFGGAEGLAHYLETHQFDRLIDATHPYARQISKHATIASQTTGIALQRIDRPPWEKRAGDRWIEVGSIPQAVEKIPARARVFLALGSQSIGPFACRADAHFVIRMVDKPAAPLPFASHTLILGQPAADWKRERKILETHRVSHLVCRNSGGSASYAKLEAARHLQLPVIMIQRD